MLPKIKNIIHFGLFLGINVLSEKGLNKRTNITDIFNSYIL